MTITSGPPVETTEAADAEKASQRDQIAGRLLEAKGTDSAGGRVFGVRVIAYGDSKNGRHYPEAVMREAAPLYSGAKCYDHHRSESELRSSTIAGMVGYFSDVAAGPEGIDADLHLLPSATHTAEALDASLAAQERGLPPLVGISHDVLAQYRTAARGGRRMMEAVKIVKINSADVVADPAAGGMVTRMVAGGTDDLDDVLDVEPAEQLHDTGTARGRAVIAQEAAALNLPETVAEHVTRALPARFSEAQLSAALSAVQAATANQERAGLTPTTAGRVSVTGDERDRKAKALDAMLSIDGTGGGYRTLREAYLDITGRSPRFLDEDLNRSILRDSIGRGYDSAMRGTESMDSTSWAEVLGDSVTRRLIAEYSQPNLMVWKNVVSSIQTGLDFRTQRRGRVGGYGTLPPVNQGAAYQPLTSPTDEEATYSLSKRGGTEDLTLEMVANDDIQAIRSIPMRLGRSAAITLYRFIFDLFPANAATTYDGVTLFHASHANTDNPAVLAQATLTAGRKKMRKQAAYGDSVDILSIVPRYLIVPTDLEETAFQLTASVNAIPATSNDPADRPNINTTVEPIVVDYYTDINDWYLVADPALCPTIEVGFYARQTEPELFTQSDPNQGSVFDRDAVTWKIRHVYSGTVLDHRGFYRGNN